jgi:acyl carrier protein
MMTDAEILAAVQEVAREHVGFEGTLDPDQRLVEDLELDSIKVLTMVVEVENRFRIVLDPEMESEIVTVDDLVRVIGGLLDDSR